MGFLFSPTCCCSTTGPCLINYDEFVRNFPVYGNDVGNVESGANFPYTLIGGTGWSIVDGKLIGSGANSFLYPETIVNPRGNHNIATMIQGFHPTSGDRIVIGGNVGTGANLSDCLYAEWYFPNPESVQMLIHEKVAGVDTIIKSSELLYMGPEVPDDWNVGAFGWTPPMYSKMVLVAGMCNVYAGGRPVSFTSGTDFSPFFVEGNTQFFMGIIGAHTFDIGAGDWPFSTYSQNLEWPQSGWLPGGTPNYLEPEHTSTPSIYTKYSIPVGLGGETLGRNMFFGIGDSNNEVRLSGVYFERTQSPGEVPATVHWVGEGGYSELPDVWHTELPCMSLYAQCENRSHTSDGEHVVADLGYSIRVLDGTLTQVTGTYNPGWPYPFDTSTTTIVGDTYSTTGVVEFETICSNDTPLLQGSLNFSYYGNDSTPNRNYDYTVEVDFGYNTEGLEYYTLQHVHTDLYADTITLISSTNGILASKSLTDSSPYYFSPGDVSICVGNGYVTVHYDGSMYGVGDTIYPDIAVPIVDSYELSNKRTNRYRVTNLQPFIPGDVGITPGSIHYISFQINSLTAHRKSGTPYPPEVGMGKFGKFYQENLPGNYPIGYGPDTYPPAPGDPVRQDISNVSSPYAEGPYAFSGFQAYNSQYPYCSQCRGECICGNPPASVFLTFNGTWPVIPCLSGTLHNGWEDFTGEIELTKQGDVYTFYRCQYSGNVNSHSCLDPTNLIPEPWYASGMTIIYDLTHGTITATTQIFILNCEPFSYPFNPPPDGEVTPTNSCTTGQYTYIQTVDDYYCIDHPTECTYTGQMKDVVVTGNYGGSNLGCCFNSTINWNVRYPTVYNSGVYYPWENETAITGVYGGGTPYSDRTGTMELNSFPGGYPFYWYADGGYPTYFIADGQGCDKHFPVTYFWEHAEDSASTWAYEEGIGFKTYGLSGNIPSITISF